MIKFPDHKWLVASLIFSMSIAFTSCGDEKNDEPDPIVNPTPDENDPTQNPDEGENPGNGDEDQPVTPPSNYYVPTEEQFAGSWKTVKTISLTHIYEGGKWVLYSKSVREGDYFEKNEDRDHYTRKFPYYIAFTRTDNVNGQEENFVFYSKRTLERLDDVYEAIRAKESVTIGELTISEGVPLDTFVWSLSVTGSGSNEKVMLALTKDDEVKQRWAVKDFDGDSFYIEPYYNGFPESGKEGALTFRQTFYYERIK